MSNSVWPDWMRSLALVPSALFVLASQRDRSRGAVLVSWVQQCSYAPPMVCVAVRRGRPIAPIIRDAHAFALSMIDPEDKYIVRRLTLADELGEENALDAIACEKLVTGSPCVTRALMVLDCEVVRHLDLEADHELYVGQVVAGKVYTSNGHPLRPDVRASGVVEPPSKSSKRNGGAPGDSWFGRLILDSKSDSTAL